MNIKFFNKGFSAFGVGMFAVAALMVSCVEDPDESSRYTFTGETIDSYLSKEENLSDFYYILQRANYDKRLSVYDQYTCFAPTNDGVRRYIDSLYNDPQAKIPHNGMSENSLEGMSDSLCLQIAKYHLCSEPKTIIDLGGGGSTVNTVYGRPVSTSVNPDGNVVLNNKAVIEAGGSDLKMTNGVVHVLTEVVPLSNKTIKELLEHLDEYSWFTQALIETGWADKINESYKLNADGKHKEYTITDRMDNGSAAGNALYWPKECKLGFTVFAESNDVMVQNGINSYEELKEYANKVYANAPDWYDYMRDKGLTVSTGTDYTNPFNALNMFVAYHILPMSMAKDQLVFEFKQGVPCTQTKWNYVNNGEPYDYYETKLPNTMMKIWQPDPKGTQALYINRYKTNNTLTDEVGTMGSYGMHELLRPGVGIVREDISAFNGYVHPITSMLVYDREVPNLVFNERMRFDATTFLPEFINNGFRYMSMAEVGALNDGGSGARIAFPLDFFDNVVCYTPESTLRYNVKGDYRAYQADMFQGWGQYDVAVRIPPVPKNGLYEVRLMYAPMDHGGMMQFYLGESSNPQEMKALGIPLDVRIKKEDPRIGWTPFYDEDDLGVATDEAMRNRGYMRGPVSFEGHPDGVGDMEAQNCRGDGIVILRRILGRLELQQSKDYWFRIKNVIKDETDLKWQIDFIEYVPVGVVDNEQYSEDWY